MAGEELIGYSIMGVFVGLAVLIFIIVVSMGYYYLVVPRKSHNYRKLMTDMFVVGKIKEFAKNEKVDLDLEIAEYLRIRKMFSLKMKDLDEVIEDRINESISEETTDKVEFKKI